MISKGVYGCLFVMYIQVSNSEFKNLVCVFVDMTEL